MKLNWNKVRTNLTTAANEIGRQVGDNAKVLKTKVEGIDWQDVGDNLQEAGQRGQALANQAVDGTRSFIERARDAWSAHAAADVDVAAAALAKVADAPSPEAAKEILQTLESEQMQAGLQVLADRWTAELGPEAAADKLHQLDETLEAARQVGQAHDRRARSVPRHKGRPDSVDPTLYAAVGALRTAVKAVEGQLAKAPMPDVYAIGASASAGLWSAGEKAASGIASWMGKGDGKGVGESIGQARRQLGETIDKASPQWLKTRYESAKKVITEATQQAEVVLNGLDGLEAEAQDRDAMFGRMRTVLDHAKNATDPDANAVSVGFLKEATVGAAGGRGKELVYLRDTGELRVVDLEMTGARIALGASKRPFARSIYGEADAIKQTSRRHTGEIGAMIFHAGASYSDAVGDDKDRVRSWHGTLGVGFNASVPLVGDQSLYSVRETTLAVHKLTGDQQAELEGLLGTVPDAARKWTSMIRDIAAPKGDA